MKELKTIIRGIIALTLASLALPTEAAESISYEVTMTGSSYPRVTVTNTSRVADITYFEMTIGNDDPNFDAITSVYKRGSFSYSLRKPDTNDVGGSDASSIVLTFSGFGPNESISFYADLDPSGSNYGGPDFRTTLFNNGTKPNAIMTASNSSGQIETITLPDGPSLLSSYTFYGGVRKRTLRVKSVVETATGNQLFVERVDVERDGNPLQDRGVPSRETTGIGSEVYIDVWDGDNIEISAPKVVYRDAKGTDITDSVEGSPEDILKLAEERFTAEGITVNDVPATGDPNLIRFEVERDTKVAVKWQHDFALTIESNFDQTSSADRISGEPWAGPLDSKAAGDPDPNVNKHWRASGDNVTPQVDSQVLDLFSHPGLDVRFIPVAYEAFGSANSLTSPDDDRIAREAYSGTAPEFSLDDVVNGNTVQFARDGTLSDLKVDPFTMSGPALVRYVWQIQFGVRVNVDSPERTALPRVFELDSSGDITKTSEGEGVFWFDPGAHLFVGVPANATGPNSTALTGWFSGDGYFFSSSGAIESSDGSLTEGGPVDKNPPIASWVPMRDVDEDGITTRYRGMTISSLQRAARVQWSYGQQSIITQANIGEYVFQYDSNYDEAGFTNEPGPINGDDFVIAGINKSINAQEMAIWDSEAARLYPLVPGRFSVPWEDSSGEIVRVVVIVNYPSPAHYPHITNTPGVALDPDPEDGFVFKELRYTENQATVDGNNLFRATQPGKSVLLFSTLAVGSGRAGPREFLQVRVVDSRAYDSNLSTRERIIGQPIADDLDRAKLGTGFVMSFEESTGQPDTARFNPYIYDVSKLEGLAAKDVYDLEKLRADTTERIIANPGNLPGPIIPVNLHPGAGLKERVVVVWYDDPAQNDELLWPHQARLYTHRWPKNATEGLGSIVISSQYGSESQIRDTGTGEIVDQEVAPGETTYNPSRFQEVQVYVQNDPTAVGYNPNDEHGVMAPSLRYAAVSPRPPASYALRNDDLNRYNKTSQTESSQPANYSSHPYVLVQFKDTEDGQYKMRVYDVVKENAVYRFAKESLLVTATPPRTLQKEPYVRMEAGEPVIPFYPLVEVVGAAPCPQTDGRDLKPQAVYWEDHKGSSWSISGGENAWFTHLAYYPMAPDFWWPDGQTGAFREISTPSVQQLAFVPQTGDCVAFLPKDITRYPTTSSPGTVDITANFATLKPSIKPTEILYKSDWPTNPPVLKAGETLTFPGGEFRADRPFRTVVDADGDLESVETAGLPGIVAFSSAEVVFDSLNPTKESAKWITEWTARVAQVLDRRGVPLAFGDFPPELQPATGRTRLKGGKFVFTELPASLQNRVRYDSLVGRLEISGLLNDKDIGEPTLTASPPAVYILEPNIFTEEEAAILRGLTDDPIWTAAVDDLVILSRNPGVIDSDNAFFKDPSAADYRSRLEQFWRHYYFGVLPAAPVLPDNPTPAQQTAYDTALADYSTLVAEIQAFPTVADLSATDPVPSPVPVTTADAAYRVGLEPLVVRDGSNTPLTVTEVIPTDPATDPRPQEFPRPVRDPKNVGPARAFGPGLALLPNSGFLDPTADYPDISWVTVAENNDPSLGGSPITVHVIQVDRNTRYRGAIKTVQSDNVFDENLGLRHTGDFGANPEELFFEWWYRPDDGSLNVPPPDLLGPGDRNPWKLFSDPSGKRGLGRYQVTLKGNPNAPEALVADTFWFVRYRHEDDAVEGTDWSVQQPDLTDGVNFTWAGAGNSDPLNDFNGDGLPDFRPQLAQGWIKRVLDAVNPYEARIRDFENDAPSTRASMISQLGARFEGPVALNPDKNVIENTGLIELYETILKRGSDLTINLSRPVSTPAISNALQLASTRISDFYTVLGNEAYIDALDPSIGFGSDSVEYGSMAPAVFPFQNQMSSQIEEELALLRGVDDFFARPVFNRLFWNFTKGEGEAAYAMNYDISDVNADGFIDEDDAMILFPQGHGDAWGHYGTALRNQYDLFRHPFFNWVSRSEFYNLQDITIKVDFLDERKFAQVAAAKAKVGAEVVDLTYRDKYVEDPTAQWQGYTDSREDRAWGVQGWARRAAQGSYFDWVTANALLPSVHPNETLEGIQKVDRSTNSDIAVVSANLNAVQTTFDEANRGQNPLGLSRNSVPVDLNPEKYENIRIGRSHFEQIYDRAIRALGNAVAIWDNANKNSNRLRKVANSEAKFRNDVFQEDLTYRNRLIAIFGRPYDGTIGPGLAYPAGYEGPDTLLFQYVDVREINDGTVPGPSKSFVNFDDNGNLVSSNGLDPADPNYGTNDIYNAFVNGQGGSSISGLSSTGILPLFAPTFADGASNSSVSLQDGLYSVEYTDLLSPKVGLENLTQTFPVTAAGYTFQAPREWGARLSTGQLQLLINQMIQKEAQIASAIGAWDGLSGEIIRTIRLINARLSVGATIRDRNVTLARTKWVTESIIAGIEAAVELIKDSRDIAVTATYVGSTAIPGNLPTGGLAVSPGDALSAAAAGVRLGEVVTRSVASVAKAIPAAIKAAAEIALSIAEAEVEIANNDDEALLNKREWIKELEDLVGDEPIKRIEIFKEIQALKELSDKYRALVNEGVRLIDERAAFNKRVAAQTQRNRYQDITFRVSRNHAMQSYRQAFEVAARYAYLAAKAYDYETNLEPTDPASARGVFSEIVKARGLGLFEKSGEGGTPRLGAGGLAESLAWLKINYDALKGQMGFNNPQIETDKISLRTELYRILPKDQTQPDIGDPQFVSPNADSNTLWTETLESARVDDLWSVPEFRYFCQAFAPESDATGNHVPQPGIVLDFGTEIFAGKNFFGKPLSGADHAYDPTLFATKIRSVGVWFADYLSDDVVSHLAETPRVYLVPVGSDIMRVASSDNPNLIRSWSIVDQRIPAPLPARTADLENGNWITLVDSLNGQLGEARRFPSFRAYHDSVDEVELDNMVYDSRLIGRSIWNTRWVLIIPGRTLNSNPDVGLDRFIEQVSDIKLVFGTYGFSGR